jgi:anti-anti-sigma factor
MHTLVLLGELNGASAACTLEAALEDLCETEVDAITLDLSKLTHIDATGVAVIAFRCRWCERRGREVALVPGARPVQRAFELAGMTDRLPFLERGAGNRSASAQATAQAPMPAQAPIAEVAPRSIARRQAWREVVGAARWRSIAFTRASTRRERARRARLAGGGV